MTMRPVKHPLRGVFTPEADMMADRLKTAVTVKEPMKDPMKLHIPTAMISCEAATFLFGASMNQDENEKSLVKLN